MHHYTYVRNNPNGNVDPQGLQGSTLTSGNLEKAYNAIKKVTDSQTFKDAYKDITEAYKGGKEGKEAVKAFDTVLKIEQALRGDDKARRELIEEGIDNNIKAALKALEIPEEFYEILKYSLELGNYIGEWFADEMSKISKSAGCRACRYELELARGGRVPETPPTCPSSGDGQWDSNLTGSAKCLYKNGTLYTWVKFGGSSSTIGRIFGGMLGASPAHAGWIRC